MILLWFILLYLIFSSVTELESIIDFTVVPNPNNGVFDIVLTSNTQTEISIALFDITGKNNYTN
jgi:hypothetical protein